MRYWISIFFVKYALVHGRGQVHEYENGPNLNTNMGTDSDTGKDTDEEMEIYMEI